MGAAEKRAAAEVTRMATGVRPICREMPAAYHVPADGPDILPQSCCAARIAEDKWVPRLICVHPAKRGAPCALLPTPTDAFMKTAASSKPGSGLRAGVPRFLRRWASRPTHLFPEGLALKVPESSDWCSYHSPQLASPSRKVLIGLYFAKTASVRNAH